MTAQPLPADARSRQAQATAQRPLWTLPASWWEDGLPERMADHIERERRAKT